MEKKYKTLMGTPTNKAPSKERQYNIDAHKKGAKHKALEGMKKEVSPEMKSMARHYEKESGEKIKNRHEK